MGRPADDIIQIDFRESGDLTYYRDRVDLTVHCNVAPHSQPFPEINNYVIRRGSQTLLLSSSSTTYYTISPRPESQWRPPSNGIIDIEFDERLDGDDQAVVNISCQVTLGDQPDPPIHSYRIQVGNEVVSESSSSSIMLSPRPKRAFYTYCRDVTCRGSNDLGATTTVREYCPSDPPGQNIISLQFEEQKAGDKVNLLITCHIRPRDQTTSPIETYEILVNRESISLSRDPFVTLTSHPDKCLNITCKGRNRHGSTNSTDRFCYTGPPSDDTISIKFSDAPSFVEIECHVTPANQPVPAINSYEIKADNVSIVRSTTPYSRLAPRPRRCVEVSCTGTNGLGETTTIATYCPKEPPLSDVIDIQFLEHEHPPKCLDKFSEGSGDVVEGSGDFLDDNGSVTYGNDMVTHTNEMILYGNGTGIYRNGTVVQGNDPLTYRNDTVVLYGNGTFIYRNGTFVYVNGTVTDGNGAETYMYGNNDVANSNDTVNYGTFISVNGTVTYDNGVVTKEPGENVTADREIVESGFLLDENGEVSEDTGATTKSSSVLFEDNGEITEGNGEFLEDTDGVQECSGEVFQQIDVIITCHVTPNHQPFPPIDTYVIKTDNETISSSRSASVKLAPRPESCTNITCIGVNSYGTTTSVRTYCPKSKPSDDIIEVVFDEHLDNYGQPSVTVSCLVNETAQPYPPLRFDTIIGGVLLSKASSSPSFTISPRPASCTNITCRGENVMGSTTTVEEFCPRGNYDRHRGVLRQPSTSYALTAVLFVLAITVCVLYAGRRRFLCIKKIFGD
ncbi:uncharacterized protein [Diadema setosum]|uniref:uncharacterized protein n=1 Tax=Diadema setosum TaxID=31175 RepID=UPI003B3B2D68